MIPRLRDLAKRWADGRYVKANDVLRHKLIRAEAAVERLGQNLEHLRRLNVANFGARCRAEARQTELEQAIVAASAKTSTHGDGWDGVVAAGLGMPDVALLLPGQRADLGDTYQEKRYHDGQGDQ